MKKVFLLLTMLFMVVTNSYAEPFVGWDAIPAVTSYKVSITSPTGGLTTTVIVSPADNPVKVDVASAAIGTSSIKVKACITDEWGEACSADSVPFDYTRHGAPVIPKNLRLIPK